MRDTTSQTARPPNSTNNMGGQEEGEEAEVGVHTPPAPPTPPPLADSLLPVVMVIRGFGQDYEIFYLATSALMQRTSKAPPPSLLRLPIPTRPGGGHKVYMANSSTKA